MRYLALATDYDGTLAHDGIVDNPTIQALEKCRQTGRKLILVTGRELPDLQHTFDRLDLFDLVVAENGALLFNPKTLSKRALASPPPPAFAEDLRQHGVKDMSAGEVIVATWEPYQQTVLESIRRLGLELQVIFNKEAVMVLPGGVNKMTGLNHALTELKLSRHNVVGVGDAENDHAFLSCCECSVAVANAIPSLKERADWVTPGARGAGVSELIGELVNDDLHSVSSKIERNRVAIAKLDDRDLTIPAIGGNLLLCGQSGGGKSTFVAGFVERLVGRGYQVCIVDPEGDYESLPGLINVGGEHHVPSPEQILQLLEQSNNAVVNLVGVKMDDRPGFFTGMLDQLYDHAVRFGRPNWLIVDEAHHLLPHDWAPSPTVLLGDSSPFGVMLVTVHPKHVSPVALRDIGTVALVGKAPREVLSEFAEAAGVSAPEIAGGDIPGGKVTIWNIGDNEVHECATAIPGTAERKRHRRKYAEGQLEKEREFVFTGPDGSMNLTISNLDLFVRIASGIDEKTWVHHLRQGDYSRWFRAAIKDDELAEIARKVESDKSLSPDETREQIVHAVEERYTAPE